MGRFNKYGTKLDMIVRGAIEEMETAEKAEREARRNLDKYPERAGNVSPDYAAHQARAKANHIEAAAALKSARQNAPEQARQEMQELRGRLEAALFEGFAARPDAVDMQAVALLNSGILKPQEYVYLVREALDKEYPIHWIMDVYWIAISSPGSSIKKSAAGNCLAFSASNICPELDVSLW